MRFAYADPPYLGMGRLYDDHHVDSREYDDPEAHRRLIASMDDQYDGWALSLHVPSLRTILPMCPDDVRICAWVKPFASFKPNVRQAYAWEPVIVKPIRKLGPESATVRDWCSANIAMRKGLPGAKPEAMIRWLFDFAGLQPGDDVVDLFPGTGVVGRTWDRWQQDGRWAMPIIEAESVGMFR